MVDCSVEWSVSKMADNLELMSGIRMVHLLADQTGFLSADRMAVDLAVAKVVWKVD
jgi:hypothetical protein